MWDGHGKRGSCVGACLLLCFQPKGAKNKHAHTHTTDDIGAGCRHWIVFVINSLYRFLYKSDGSSSNALGSGCSRSFSVGTTTHASRDEASTPANRPESEMLLTLQSISVLDDIGRSMPLSFFHHHDHDHHHNSIGGNNIGIMNSV